MSIGRPFENPYVNTNPELLEDWARYCIHTKSHISTLRQIEEVLGKDKVDEIREEGISKIKAILLEAELDSLCPTGGNCGENCTNKCSNGFI